MMKKLIAVSMVLAALSGCAHEPVMETISDDIVLDVMAEPGQILVDIPGEGALPAMDSDVGRMYFSEDYEIYIQTLSSGDIAGTIQTLSGYPAEELTVMQTREDNLDRYEFVWASAGETGNRLGRGIVLDDGSYHYAMTVLRDEDTSSDSQITWSQLFDSFRIAQ